MKKIFLLILIFLVFAIIVKFCPFITIWDNNVIIAVQNRLKDISLIWPVLAGAGLYNAMIFVPIIGFGIYFFRKYLLIDAVLFTASPFIAYILNRIVKFIVNRPRPDIELQIGEHSQTCSFPSSHTVITFCFWGLIIYYLIKYCDNRFFKTLGIFFALLWIVFEGFTRVWLGVHYPTDVLGGFLLGGIFLFAYINLIKTIGGK